MATSCDVQYELCTLNGGTNMNNEDQLKSKWSELMDDMIMYVCCVPQKEKSKYCRLYAIAGNICSSITMLTVLFLLIAFHEYDSIYFMVSIC